LQPSYRIRIKKVDNASLNLAFCLVESTSIQVGNSQWQK
jgi:hypothetical protein